MRLIQIWRGALCLICVGLLAGCATEMVTQVTAFSAWNGSDATRTYAFSRTPAQQNSLEASTYENIVANQLSIQAFKRVSAGDAHYLVELSYATRSDMRTIAQPIQYYAPPPFWVGWRDSWGPWGGAYYDYPGYSVQSIPLYTHALGVRFIARATGKEVYNVTARSTSGNSSLVNAMPYLARSALMDFPMGNGAVRTVRIPVDKNQGANEVALPAAPSVQPAQSIQPAQ